MKKLYTYLILSAALLTFTGCIGFASNLMYMLEGLKIEAAYDGLSDSKVAVIVVSDASSYGPDTLARVVSRSMGTYLNQNVDGIKIIPQNIIENWQDTHGWDRVDFREIGRGVNAEKVVAVELESYSIHEGMTLYKGRSMVTTTVYDMSEDEGQVVFSQGPAEYLFPKGHATPVMSNTEQQFEALYLSKLVENISRNFYDYDKAESIAEDATAVGFH